MVPRFLDSVHSFIASLLNGAAAQLDEGFVPFLTSPYGIGLLLVVMFLFLNSSRRRL